MDCPDRGARARAARLFRAWPFLGAPSPGHSGRDFKQSRANEGGAMPGWGWAVVIVALVVAVAVVMWRALAARRTRALRERFGPEYERTTAAVGNRREAEAELAGRTERREQLNVRPLPAEARQRYARQWETVQSQFVDSPPTAITAADGLVSAVMADRGLSDRRLRPASGGRLRRPSRLWSRTIARHMRSRCGRRAARQRPKNSGKRCRTTGRSSRSSSPTAQPTNHSHVTPIALLYPDQTAATENKPVTSTGRTVQQ